MWFRNELSSLAEVSLYSFIQTRNTTVGFYNMCSGGRVTDHDGKNYVCMFLWWVNELHESVDLLCNWNSPERSGNAFSHHSSRAAVKVQLQTGERPVIFFSLANKIALQLLHQPVPTLHFTTFRVTRLTEPYDKTSLFWTLCIVLGFFFLGQSV